MSIGPCHHFQDFPIGKQRCWLWGTKWIQKKASLRSKHVNKVAPAGKRPQSVQELGTIGTIVILAWLTSSRLADDSMSLAFGLAGEVCSNPLGKARVFHTLSLFKSFESQSVLYEGWSTVSSGWAQSLVVILLLLVYFESAPENCLQPTPPAPWREALASAVFLLHWRGATHRGIVRVTICFSYSQAQCGLPVIWKLPWPVAFSATLIPIKAQGT